MSLNPHVQYVVRYLPSNLSRIADVTQVMRYYVIASIASVETPESLRMF